MTAGCSTENRSTRLFTYQTGQVADLFVLLLLADFLCVCFLFLFIYFFKVVVANIDFAFSFKLQK